MSSLKVEGLLDGRLVALFKSIQHGSVQTCLLTPSDRGLKISTDSLRVLQSHLYLPSSTFRSWIWRSPGEEDTQDSSDGIREFGMPLAQFLQVLELCKPTVLPGKKAAEDDSRLFKLEWNSNSDRVSFKMNDNGAFDSQIECSIATVTAPDIPRFTFTDENTPVLLKIITKGEFMREWLLQLQSETRITIEADPTISFLTLSAEDQGGSKQVIVSAESERIESYSCVTALCNTYPTNFLRNTLNILTLASKASLRINALGALSVQMMISTATDTAFLEYILAPLVDTI